MTSQGIGVGRTAALVKRARDCARARLPNALLSLASILICYFVLELTFFRVILPLVPFHVRPHLPVVADVLMQNTKAGYLPRNYVALLGDSYADGIGDWLLAVGGNRSKPFHSANIIHELTGRDIVSLGKGPSGSAEGMVLRPAVAFTISRCYLFPTIEEPSRIVYYFVETNDIEDNLLFIEYVKRAYGRVDADSIKRFLNDRWGVVSRWHCNTHFPDTMFRMAKFAFQYYVQKKDIRQRARSAANALTIGGEIVPAGPLFGPALALAPHEIEAGLMVFDPSLAWLRRRLPDVPVTVVYIPSPLWVYAPHMTQPVKTWRAHPWMVLAVEDRDGVAAADLANRASDLICARIRSFSVAHGATFIDARPALRAAAGTRPIHGPIDWSHLNEQGNPVLGQLVADRLNSGNLDGPCAQPG